MTENPSNNTKNLEKMSKDLSSSIYYVVGACIFGSIFFFVAYAYSKEMIILILGVLILLGGVSYIFIIQRLRDKLELKYGNKEKELN